MLLSDCRPRVRCRAVGWRVARVLGALVVGVAHTSLPAQVRAELIPEHSALRPGDSTRVAVVLHHAPGWHTYWRRGGDAGLPTRVRWTLDAALRADTLQWPAPSSFRDLGVVTYGYQHDAPLVTALTVAPNATASRDYTIDARVDWLACQTQCIPGGTALRSTVTVARTRATNPAFARALRAPGVVWPTRATTGLVVRRSGDTLALSATAPLARTCRFFSETAGVPAALGVVPLARNGSPARAVVSSRVRLPDTLRGVLSCDGTPASATHHTIPIGTTR
jgi:DsbC/DsbD-like thiol-disulfide interchange protein